jgi:hypothetical protein
MSDYDDTNRGALFNASNQKLIRRGPVNINGEPLEIAIVQTKTKNGKIVFEVYQKIGAVFTNDDKTSEKSPDMSGTVEFQNREWQMAGWKSEGRSGTPYTSVAISEKQTSDGGDGPPEWGGDSGDLDDEIPF